jgi:hypothetical protein
MDGKDKLKKFQYVLARNKEKNKKKRKEKKEEKEKNFETNNR